MASGSPFSTTSTLPPGHPIVDMHEHANGNCPVAGKTHAYCPPQKGDVRSVCPALNTMANHGYIPRDGRNLTFGVLFRGLKACYGLSTTLTLVLVTGGYLGIKRNPIRIPYVSNLLTIKNPDGSTSPGGVIDLHLIGLHNGIEHDASLVHLNALPEHKYPPLAIQDAWVPELVGDIQPPVPGYHHHHHHHHTERSDSSASSDSSSSTDSTGSGYYASAVNFPYLQKFINDPAYLNVLVDEADVGRMRARRQKDILPLKLNAAHAEIARGEMAIILGVWNQKHGEKTGIPLPWLLKWLSEERLPEVPIDGASAEEVKASDTSSESSSSVMWRPSRKQTLSNVRTRSNAIRKVTNEVEGHQPFLTAALAWIRERFEHAK